MRHLLPTLLLLPLLACGGSPSSPSPAPTPSPAPVPAPQPAPPPQPTTITVSATLTDTVSGAAIGAFTQTVPRLPAFVAVSAPGHLTRQTLVGSATPTIDLIGTAAPFSMEYYHQLVRGTLEDPIQPITVLPQAPSIYVQTRGLSSSNVSELESAARAVVPAMTGGRFSVVTFQTGSDVRPVTPGWIVADLITDTSAHCGQSLLGVPAGHIWLNTAAKCTVNGNVVMPSLFAHELGHALGFYHVDVPSALMHATVTPNATASDAERYHAAIAYRRQTGNVDPDTDSTTVAPLRTRRMVDN